MKTEQSSTTNVCVMSVSDEMKLWHQRLEHVHLRKLKQISTSGVLCGIPEIKESKDFVCGNCKVGKMINTSLIRTN